MDDIGKVYTATVTPDTAFPTPAVEQTSTTTTQTTANDTYSPTNTQDTPFPVPVIAQETVSQTLNTKTKKILAEYNFTPSGAIGIGKFQAGVSGDVRITPNGIIARNISGDSTITIDGDTGDVTVRGTIEAKDFVIADEQGVVSLNAFHSGNITAQDVLRLMTTNTPTVIPNTTLTFVLPRATNVMIMFNAVCFFDQLAGTPATGVINLYVDGIDTDIATDLFLGPITASLPDISQQFSQSFQTIQLLPAGQHTIAFYGRISSGTSAEMGILDTSTTYLLLGN